MRPEGAFVRALQRTEDVVLGRGVNLFDMCVRGVRVLWGLCANGHVRCSN
jgi:hypothetical protein